MKAMRFSFFLFALDEGRQEEDKKRTRGQEEDRRRRGKMAASRVGGVGSSALSSRGVALGFALHNNEIVHGSSSGFGLSFSTVEDGESLMDSTVLSLS